LMWQLQGKLCCSGTFCMFGDNLDSLETREGKLRLCFWSIRVLRQ